LPLTNSQSPSEHSSFVVSGCDMILSLPIVFIANGYVAPQEAEVSVIVAFPCFARLVFGLFFSCSAVISLRSANFFGSFLGSLLSFGECGAQQKTAAARRKRRRRVFRDMM
ncbi:hypothetical protein PMAYCL1PPCAC_14615, partial [Pristionchus mayeri]